MKTEELKMILAYIFKKFGTFLHRYTPEEICFAILLVCSFCVFLFGFYFYAICSAICSWKLYMYLILPNVISSDSRYGSYDLRKSHKLGSYRQIKRRELLCNKGKWFEDNDGRKIILRGVNVCGSSKFPINCQTHKKENFYNTKDISFVGRPFPLDEADEHFSRIQAFGLTFIRLLVTWEAIEHIGPGIYDKEYLEYLLKIVRIAAKYNIACMIDPHQDVWSRWTGGDGAPAWTLELAGFQIDKLHDSGTSFTHQGYFEEHGEDSDFPVMFWPSNHHRLATATMFTLFFGGNDFCPNFTVSGQNIQDYLQGHYFAAFQKVAEILGSEDNVIGFDSMNEPNFGMIGWEDLSEESLYLRQGPTPTFFESFQLGDGYEMSVNKYNPTLIYDGKCKLNSKGVRAWKYNCIWEEHNVWGKDTNSKPILFKPNYFKHRTVNGTSQPVNCQNDYFIPFISKFREAINKGDHASGKYMIFVDRVTDFETASISEPMSGNISLENLAWAPHWYDLVPLVTKSFRSWVGVVRDGGFSFPLVFGSKNVINEYSRQLSLVSSCVDSLNYNKGIPTIIGEIGIPFDTDNRKCYEIGDFSTSISAMNITISALDKSLLSGILWNYTPDHTVHNGDGWNGEDLSIYSTSLITHQNDCDIFAGGRALSAIIRPYMMRCAGIPRLMHFDIHSRIFTFEFSNSPDELITSATIIFVPFFQYEETPDIQAHGCTFDFDSLIQH